MFLTPSMFILVLLVAGSTLLPFPKYRRPSLAFLIGAAALFVVFGSGLTATWLLGRLEFRHPAAQLSPTGEPVAAIVLLTGYAEHKSDVPITGQLNRASAVRVLETARLHAAKPLPIYISGYDAVPRLLEQALQPLLGPNSAIHLDTRALSTYESATNLQPHLAKKPFYLVTSAGHMPRSLAVFESLGMRPVAAPTDYLTRREWYRADWWPTSAHLEMSDLAVHEYLGMLWYRMRGWI